MRRVFPAMCRDWIFIPGSGELRGAPAQGSEASCPWRKRPLAAAAQVTGRGARSARSCTIVLEERRWVSVTVVIE